MSTDRSGKDKKPRQPWRENIEAMTVAIVMAVMLKYFAVEAYQIPTGSMQPTLMGQEFREGLGIAGEVKDRILVDKLSFHVRDPERFEVVIFKYPLNRAQNFVKRLVGMPNEQLRIHAGDVWRRDEPTDEWTVIRRPAKVQADQWKEIDVGEPANGIRWRATDPAAQPIFDGRSALCDRPVRLEFAAHGGGPILDVYAHGYPLGMQRELRRLRDGHVPTNDVGDLRVTGEIEPAPELTALAIELSEGPRRYRFEIPGPAAPAGASARIRVQWAANEAFQPIDVEVAGARLDGSAQEFAVENLDDQLALELDGRQLASVPIPLALDQQSGVALALEGGGAELVDLQVWRDIYYTPGSEPHWTIPDGHYFMMGDNTQDSSDSRVWELVHLSWTGSPSGGEPIAGNLRSGGLGAYRLDSNPIRAPGEQGLLTFFRDVYGELHVFPSASETSGVHPPVTHAPFVPRHLITGRALAVFWPFSFRYSTYRLKWIR
jgi:signal peptidase I